MRPYIIEGNVQIMLLPSSLAYYDCTGACLFGMGGACEVRALISPQFYLEHIASLYCRLRLEKLTSTVGPTVCRTLGSLVEPSLLSDRYSWALVSVAVSLKI